LQRISHCITVNPLTPTVAIWIQPSSEHQSARMSKITNGGLTRSGRGCFFIAVPIMATVGVKGLKLQSRLSPVLDI